MFSDAIKEPTQIYDAVAIQRERFDARAVNRREANDSV